jgi:hypothetical protein
MQYSKLLIKLIADVTLKHHTYISQYLCHHKNVNFFSEGFMQHLNKSRDN